MSISRTYALLTFSLAALLVTLGLAGWLWGMVTSMRSEVASLLLERNGADARTAYALTLRSLERDTRAERIELNEKAVAKDVLAIINIVEAAGEATRTTFSIEAVSPGSFSALNEREEEALPAIALTVKAEGSFADLYHLVSLLETLPILSVVDSVGIERAGERGWSALIRLRAASDIIYEQ